MAHQSEQARRLDIVVHEVSAPGELPTPDPKSPDVWLFTFPYGRNIGDNARPGDWLSAIQRLATASHEQSIIAVLASPPDAAEILTQLGQQLHSQIWVAVKLSQPMAGDTFGLPQHHAALLVMSRYRAALRHTKTRIAYTYCPACDKTTKDYGGKKHTYHEYGTLMSDVWRDIAYTPGEHPRDVVDRLADLFGLEPHRTIRVIDVSHATSLRSVPTRTRRARVVKRNEPHESRLINGDALVELRKLPADSVDFCFADPPYNLAKRYDAWNDAIDARAYLEWCDTWLDELARVLRPGCTCAVLNIPILAVRHFQHMKRKLEFQSWIAWEGLSLPVRMIMPAHYAIVCFSKGPPRQLPGLIRKGRGSLEQQALTSLRENYCVRQTCVEARGGQSDRQSLTDLWWDVHRLKHNSRRVDHPCQLPPALMHRLIALHTVEGEAVLDPFNGAGTTTLCADMLGRRYIGIELSETYHRLAESRHALLQSGGDPFEKVNAVPKSKNSRVGRIGGIRYEVPKKTLQLEVKRVARQLGKLPTREELAAHGRYPIRYYDEYFLSWGEVCAAARTTGMSERRSHTAQGRPLAEPQLFDHL
jgi:site-specific DNA-methyltransferase (adenine-specific)